MTDPLDLAALLGDPRRVAEVPIQAVPGLVGVIASEQARLAALQGALAARMMTRSSQGHGDPDELLTVTSAAALLGMSPQWLYKNARRFPFTRRVGSRALRFSARGIRRYLDNRPTVA